MKSARFMLAGVGLAITALTVTAFGTLTLLDNQTVSTDPVSVPLAPAITPVTTPVYTYTAGCERRRIPAAAPD